MAAESGASSKVCRGFGGQIADAEVRVGNLPPDLRALYLTTNGIGGETFEILPLFNPREPKRTWESIERANDVATSKCVDDAEFLQRFQIFADCSGGFAAFDRTDGSIWYSEGDDLHQVDVNLREFLELLLKERILDSSGAPRSDDSETGWFTSH